MESTYAILLVDDQVIETGTIRTIIENLRLPLHVSTASNGEEALELLRSNSFDILFTDIKMPRMNGLDLARHAKLLNPSVQLIIYSAFGEFEYAKEAIDLGAIHYLLKPLDREEFAAVMDKAIEKCRKHRELQASGFDDRSSSDEGVQRGSELPTGSGSDENTRKVVRDVQALIQSRYGDSGLSVDYLASEVFLSASYLGHLFKNHTGQNLGKYIIAVRMENAKRLLATTHTKIAEIGQAVGYPNPSYFSMLFRMQFGCTPVQYREQGERS
ncbi:DNA-binding response regulator [Paenibacillus agaridevorans]|uniref:DNA-binding response regulator n=1 Tax=Paenibacillus agaridevorans TaxID=171404 RepID=A0A2R5EWR9_9BACL|nr:response regulator [Paenibacillus agaridevorans]GBG11100.1 DNA-binding response regulator [Paenibacillus agaridevorans]